MAQRVSSAPESPKSQTSLTTKRESLKTLPLEQFRRNLFRLQKRVYKAIFAGDKRKAMSLQKLILKSKAARLLAIGQVTQLNAGKKTARHFCSSGILPKDASAIDGKKSLTFKERFELEKLLEGSSNDWTCHSLRSIPIPKKDGSTRMLKIPTIADRAWQCLAKYALYQLGRCTIPCQKLRI